MNARENALRIIHFDNPERVVARLPALTVKYQGVDHENYEGPGDEHPAGSRWSDIWGIQWHKEMDGVMGFPEVCPLADVSSLKGYAWPDPNDERICRRIYDMKQGFLGDELFLGGSHRDTLWEKAYMLAGMENLMVCFFTEPGFVREILHRIMDFQLGIAAHYAAAGVEVAFLGDDLGTQLGPLLSPKIVQEFLAPEYRRLFDFYRRRGVIIEFHSCGRIDWMLETFMDLGVDVLNPVQASANDLVKIRSVTQGRMALAGAINSATVMDGPVERIESTVQERIRLLGKNGGYFCRPDQSLPFPPQHLAALNNAVERFGRYPIQVGTTS